MSNIVSNSHHISFPQFLLKWVADLFPYAASLQCGSDLLPLRCTLTRKKINISWHWSLRLVWNRSCRHMLYTSDLLLFQECLAIPWSLLGVSIAHVVFKFTTALNYPSVYMLACTPIPVPNRGNITPAIQKTIKAVKVNKHSPI